MSLGESNKSKYGGVSALTERLRRFSGAEAATEASFERNGSFGFKGGMGILAALLAPKARQLSLKVFGLRTDWEEAVDGTV